MRRLKIILHLLLLFSFIPIINTFKCGTNNIKKLIPKIITSSNQSQIQKSDTQPNDRNLRTTNRSLKIYFDYTKIEYQIKNEITTISTEQLSLLKSYMEETAEIFSKLLTVESTTTIIKISEEKVKEQDGICGEVEYSLISSEVFNGIEADVIIFPFFYDLFEEDDIEAAAAICGLGSDYRPNIGALFLNPHTILTKINTDRYLKYLFLHEITHVLVFSTEIFNYFKGNVEIDKKIINNKTHYYYSSPNVIKKAKEHFGCDSLTALELENQGGEGSAGAHWEARYMLGDYMISTEHPEILLSDITLAMFEDSGWYEVNYYTGGLFKFGKNAGCNFFSDSCINKNINNNQTFYYTNYPNEFCVKGSTPKCSSSRTSKGKCYKVKYLTEILSEYQYFSQKNIGGFRPANYCPVFYDSLDYKDTYYAGSCTKGVLEYKNYGETIGDNSMCYISSLSPSSIDSRETPRSICLTTDCDYEKKKIIITLSNSLQIFYPEEGGEITNIPGYSGRIFCPAFSFICSGSILCYDLEDCVNKKSTTKYYINISENYFNIQELENIFSDKNSKEYLYVEVISNDNETDEGTNNNNNFIRFNYFIFYLYCILFIIN